MSKRKLSELLLFESLLDEIQSIHDMAQLVKSSNSTESRMDFFHSLARIQGCIEGLCLGRKLFIDSTEENILIYHILLQIKCEPNASEAFVDIIRSTDLSQERIIEMASAHQISVKPEEREKDGIVSAVSEAYSQKAAKSIAKQFDILDSSMTNGE